MHGQADDVVGVHGEELLGVLAAVVGDAGGRRRVGDQTVDVVHQVVPGIVRAVAVDEVQLEVMVGLLVRVVSGRVRRGCHERGSARLTRQEAVLGGALHRPIRGSRSAVVSLVLLRLDVGVDALVREHLQRPFVVNLLAVAIFLVVPEGGLLVLVPALLLFLVPSLGLLLAAKAEHTHGGPILDAPRGVGASGRAKVL